jgi:hypothetical protein
MPRHYTAIAVRTVIVSPSTRETRRVIAAVFFVAYAAAILTEASWCTGVANQPTMSTSLASDEIAFRELPSDDQRIYNEAVGGLADAESVRSRTGRWPDVAELAARHIAPFAPDPIDRAAYAWRIERDGLLVNYIGTPSAESKRPELAIIVLEPDPSTPIDPEAVEDEQHHKLRDGTLLHVSIWRGSRTLAAAVTAPPIELGWRRITTMKAR